MRKLADAASDWATGARLALPALLSSALLAFSLSACTPPADKAVADAPAQSDPALEKIERQGAAQPELAAKSLLALYEKQAPGSFAALNILSLRGAMLGLAHDGAGVDALLDRLESWPDAKWRDLAKATARYVRARQLTESGQQLDAEKQMSGVSKRQLRETPPALRIRFLRALGRMNYLTGHADAAIAPFLEALTLAEQSDQRWLQALCRAELAAVYIRTEQPDQALAMVDAATRLAEQDPDPMSLFAVFNARSVVYGALHRLAESQQAAEAAIRYAREAGSRNDLALSLANQADDYLQNGDYAKAFKLSEEALTLTREAKNGRGEVVALANMGLAKIGLGEIEQGKALARQGIDLGRSQGSISMVGDLLNELGLALEKAGDLGDATRAFHQSREISDEWLQQKDRKAMLEAQERFDSERRVREMNLLSRDNNIAAEQLRQGSLQMRLWALLAGSLVVLGVLLYMLYQRVRKTNAALASSNELLKIQGEVDPLTGLANRRHFQLSIKRLAQDGKLRGTVFLIDIDFFKRINDNFGHASGDAVLVEVAQRLRQAVRADDLVVRWGGEEFLIVIESIASETVQALAQRLLDLIGAQSVRHAGRSIAVTASIGFASFPLAPNGLEVGWERAINLVDTVMYLAKAHGRNRAYGMAFFDVQSETELGELARDMDTAWRRGRVALTALQGPQHEDEVAA